MHFDFDIFFFRTPHDILSSLSHAPPSTATPNSATHTLITTPPTSNSSSTLHVLYAAWSLANSRSESSIGWTSGPAPCGGRVSPTVCNTRVSRASASKAPPPLWGCIYSYGGGELFSTSWPGTTAGTCEDQANTTAHTGEQPSTSTLVIGRLFNNPFEEKVAAVDNLVIPPQHTTESVLPLPVRASSENQCSD